MRGGFTLIEVVLALLLFEFGMLALAATLAVSAGDLAAANRRMRAGAVADARVALLRTRHCPDVSSGTRRLPGGLEEHWTVTSDGAARMILDSVAIALPRGRESSVVRRSWVWCA